MILKPITTLEEYTWAVRRALNTALDDAPPRPVTVVALQNGGEFARDRALLARDPRVERGGVSYASEPIRVHSYSGTQQLPVEERTVEVPSSLNLTAGSHVILVDDIWDTGWTLSTVRKRLMAEHDITCSVVVGLLRGATADFPRGERTCLPVTQDIAHAFVYYGLLLNPDIFVVGAGMDYHGALRDLPCPYEVLP